MTLETLKIQLVVLFALEMPSVGAGIGLENEKFYFEARKNGERSRKG